MTFDPELEKARKAWESYEQHVVHKFGELQEADRVAGRQLNAVATRLQAEEACKHLRPENVFDAIRGQAQAEQAEAAAARDRITKQTATTPGVTYV